MSFRKLMFVAAVGSALAVAAPALPGQAAPSGGCPYPPNKPVMTFTVTPATVYASHSVSQFGKMSQNGCGIKNASMIIQRRALVSGKPSGSWTTLKTVTTNTNGVFSSTRFPMHNEQERVVFKAAGGFPGLTSVIRTVTVRTHLSFNPTEPGSCNVHIVGRTIPKKAGRVVKIQSRGAKGHFNGWTTLWKTTTNSKGVYSTTHTLTCGKAYNLSALIGSDSTNSTGRARTIFGIKPVH